MRNYKVRKFFKVIAVFLCLVMIGSVLTYCFYTPFKNYVNKTFNIKTKQTSTITKESSNDANYEIIESFETQLKNMEFQIGDFEERLLAYENTAISNSGTFANIKKQLEELTTDLNTLKSDYESTNEENTAAISSLRTSLAEANATFNILASNISNPNLLINSDFRVNQRNFKSSDIIYGNSKYSFDRWKYFHWGNSAEITKNSDGSITIYNNTTTTNQGEGILYFNQAVEDFYNKTFNNETYTISCKYKLEYPDNSQKGDVYFYMEQAGATVTGTQTMKLPVNSNSSIISETFTVNGQTTKFLVSFNLRKGAKLTLYYVKLETGSIATTFTQKPYVEELMMCQRYYYRISATTSSNKQISFGFSNGVYAYFPFTFPIPLRTGTNLKFEYSDIDCFDGISGGSVTVTELVLTNASAEVNNLTFRAAVTGTKEKDVLMLRIKQSATGYIAIDAEIY